MESSEFTITIQEQFESFEIGTSDANSSTSALSAVRLRETPVPPRTASTTTPFNTGHLDSLMSEQREALLQLWGLVFDQLGQPFDATVASSGALKRKTSQVREEMLKNLRQSQVEVHRQTRFGLDGQESAAIETNPLTAELFMQFSTDDPDRVLLRFLRARQWVVVDAFAMLLDGLRWRHTVGLRKLMMTGESAIKTTLLEGGKNYFWKEDRDGRLVCYIRSRLHDRNAQTLQESIDFTLYTVEVGRRLRRHDEQLVTAIFDLRDAPLASLDIPCMQFMVSTLQSFYPEILGKCLILDAPWIFAGFWRLVKPLLDPVVAAKIEFIKVEDLPKYIETASIPLEYGGTDPFFYSYSPPPATRTDRPNPIPRAQEESDAQLLLARLAILRVRFIESTREMYSLVSRVEDPLDLEKLLIPVKEARDELKGQLQRCYTLLDSQVLAPSWYQRIGVLSEDYKIQWEQYNPTATPLKSEDAASVLLRASAPPALRTATTE